MKAKRLFALPGEWYAVVNSCRVVLAVFGSALRGLALESREIWASRMAAGTNDYAEVVVVKVRPRVGDVLPAEGQVGEEGD